MNHFIFDWDGTLANTMGVWLEFFKSLFAELNVQITEDEIRKKVFGGKDFIQKLNLEQHSSFIEQRFSEVYGMLQKPPLFPGTLDLLEFLSSKAVTMSIVTSSGHKALDPALEFHNIKKYFKTVICAEDVVNLKPNPEPVLKAIGMSKVLPENTLMVGDSPKDLEAAHASGIKCGIFYSPVHSSFKSKKIFEDLNADYFFSDISEVAEILSTKKL